jgi:hypothetical protein
MIKIANAPCSWGALEFDLEGEAPDYVQVLNEIAETGYAGTELGDWGLDCQAHGIDRPWYSRSGTRLRPLSIWGRRRHGGAAQIRQTSMALSLQGLSPRSGQAGRLKWLGLLSSCEAGCFL